MEFVLRSGIKIPNAVLVSGVVESPDDEEVLEFLKQYGSFRVVSVDDSTSEYFKNLIVEYKSGDAMEALASVLPYTYELKGKPSAEYQVKALASVYTARVGSGVTRNYLGEIKQLAKLSGKDFEEVLKSMMSEISEIIEVSDTEVEYESSPRLMENPIRPNQLEPTVDISETLRQQLLTSPPQVDSAQGGAEPHLLFNLKEGPLSTAKDLNPPEVQKVIVEHIVRKDDLIVHSHPPMRLRSFSGKIPRPSGEADYNTWRSHVELLKRDPAIPDLQKSRKILESLLSPAADIVNRLSSDATPEAYLQLLDAAFGTVEDGEELFAQFMNTLQDPGEKASAYLCRLQVALSLAERRGGIAAGEADKYIIKQFCRGCWDSSLISDLNLEEKKKCPPTFSDLLLMLRTEEDRQATKAIRMKKHLNSTRQRAMMHSQNICTCNELQAVIQPESDPVTDLKKQVASLQSQLTTLLSKKNKRNSKPKGNAKPCSVKAVTSKLNAEAASWKPASSKQLSQPNPWYCFKCGEDGHISTNCSNDPNPTLVAEKRKQLREKRHAWEQQTHPSDNQDF